MPLLDFSNAHLVASSQKYWFHGITLASVSYGGNLTLFILCLNLLRCRAFPGRGETGVDRTRYRWGIFSLCYTTLIFGLATVSIVLEIIVEERAFTQSRVTILRPVYVILISCHFLSMGLLAWRCLILYQASLANTLVFSRVPVWVVVMVLPFCLLVASVGIGIIFAIDAIAPQKLPSVLSGPSWIIIWGSIAVALLWTLTGLIVLRLLTYCWITRKALGNQQRVKYTRLIAIFIESAGPLSLFCVIFIVVFSLKSPALAMLPFPLTQIQVLSSLLNIYQITTGKAWSGNAIETLPMPAFADIPSESSGIQAGCEGRSDGGEVGEIVETQSHSGVAGYLYD